MDEEEEAEIRSEIAALTEEHRDLDQMIARVSEAAPLRAVISWAGRRSKAATPDLYVLLAEVRRSTQANEAE